MSQPDDNSPYRSIDRLETCMQEPHRWCLVMEADCGGWPLVVCPLTMLQAAAEVRAQILLDLEDITSGRGFCSFIYSQYSDAQEMLYRGRVEEICARPWFAPRGHLHRGVWIEQKIHDAEVRDQIVRVLTGHQLRLMLPECWPHDPAKVVRPAATLEEGRAHGTGAVLEAGFQKYASVFEAPVSIVRVPLERVERLVSEVVHARPHPDPKHAFAYPLEPEVRISLHPVQCQHPQDYVHISYSWKWLDDEETCRRIRGVLMGERDRF